MKRKLFFMTLLMLFCSVMFGNNKHWEMTESAIVMYSDNMPVSSVIYIDDEEQVRTDLELAAFCDGILRGVAKIEYNSSTDKYVAVTTVLGNKKNELIRFKLYDPILEKELDTDYYVYFDDEAIVGTPSNPIEMRFYNRHWNLDDTNMPLLTMTFSSCIMIDGQEQSRTNLELAAFCGDELRGWAQPTYSPGLNKYVAYLLIYGDDDEKISFKLYDPELNNGKGKELLTDYSVTFDSELNLGLNSIDFRNEAVAQVGNTYYTTLEAALKALTENATLTILEDITISSDWDCRNTGAKITVPVTINGNGKTIKFTGKINDGYNHLAAFRFEAPVTVNNLTVDMSEAVAVFQNRFSAISTKANLTVNESKFIGSTTYANSRAIIFGEGGHEGLEIVVNETEFINWKYGVVDNMNGGDVKSVTITGNTFNSADVVISAKETVTFTGNDMSSNSYVNITSYTVPNNVAVTATGNTNLAANTETEYNQIVAPTIVAQDGFLTPVAEAGGKYYMTLSDALAATTDNAIVTIIKSTNETIGVPAGNNITIKALEGVELSGGAGGSYYNKSVTFDGLTFKGGKGIALTAGVDGITYTVKNCKFDGVQATAWKQGVISLNGKAIVVVENNIITNVMNATEGDGRIDSEGQQSTGIYTSNAVAVTISGNTITNVDGTGISSNSNAGKVDIKDNTVSKWGTGATAKNEGRAIRTSGGTEVAITGNVMIDNGTAKESFVKSTDFTTSLDASMNYWNGQNPVASDLFEADNTDPVNYVKNYYTDVDKQSLVTLSVSVAKVGDKYYQSVNEAINSADDDAIVQLLPGTIEEYVYPWPESNHSKEKSITILGSENFGTTLTGGMYLGYDDSQCRDHSIIVKGVAFKTKGILVACQKNVTIEGNKFENITDNVASPGSANANAISVIGKNINATVTGNVIDGTASAGINLRDTKTVNVSGNTVTNTVHNSITVQNNTTAEGDIVEIKDNTLSNWGTGVEGRAVRIAGGAEANVNGNVMSCATAPEEFVKVTNATTVDASANYWNGNSPLSGNYFLSDLAADPVSILKSYYTDAAKSNLVQLSPSVAKIGTTYYQTINAAIAAAQPGETVTILAGDHTADITINKAITVVGETDEQRNNLVNITGRVSAYTGATVKNLNVNNAKTGDYDCALNVNGKDIVVDGVKLTGHNAMRYCYASGDITIKNSTINGSNFAVHFDGSEGGNIVFENTDIKGWASYASTVNNVSYTGCYFDQGDYFGHRYYNKNISFSECTFEAGFLIDLRVSGSDVAFADADMTVAEVKALFKDPYYVASGNVTLNNVQVTYAASGYTASGPKYFDNLQDAINEVNNGGYITVRSNIELTQGVTVPAGKSVEIGLGDFDITYTSDVMGEAMIDNKGELTISGNGDVVYTYTGAADAAYTKGNYTITNSGKLTIDGVTVENATAKMSHASYAINNGNNGEVDIKKGNVINTNNYAMRQFGAGSIIVNDGEVKGTRAIWLQAPGSNTADAPAISLTIKGGTLTATGESEDYKLAIYSYSYGNDMKNVNIDIVGGTFNGDIALTGGKNKNNVESLNISGGIFNGKDGDVYSYAADEIAVPAISITGGIFSSNYAEIYALDDGFVFVQKDGKYELDKLEEGDEINISNLNELIAFRNAVNAGNTFAGQTVVLSGNVNLAPTRSIENWIPIGTIATPFKGTFDGGNDTISNLNVDGGAYVGLFGYADKATIKNVNIKNANVKGTDCVGVIAGSVYSESTIENCHISGLIQVEGLTKVGGIHGYGYAKIIKSSVVGNNGSYVKGTYNGADKEGDNVGGIVGHGGEGNTISACTVKNISVIGTRKVGGIVGTTDRAKVLDNCLVDGIVIENTAEAAYAGNNVATTTIGGLIGNYHGTGKGGSVINCVVKNVTFNVGNAKNVGPIVGGYRLKPNEEITDVTASGNLVYMSTITDNTTNMYLMNAVAKIGETKYYTLQEAVDAGNGETINVIGNTTEVINIADNAVIDLNFSEGVTLNGYFAPFKGNLTINGGTINNTNSGYSAIEINAGELNLENVNISSARHAVRIDGAVEATINGGKYTLTATSGTRHAVNVSGGAEVTITAGTFVGPKGTTMDSGSAVNVQTGSTVTIEGGDFSKGKNHTLSAAGTLIVKGGKFDQDPSAYLAPGYVAVKNGNVWTVGLGVAKLNGVTYVSLQAAIDAAVVGDNAIQLLANIDGDVRVSQQEGVNITINGKISDTENYQFNGTVFVDGNSRSTGTETLTIQDINFYTADDSRDFISCNDGGNAVIRYAHNVTVRNCNFTATETSNAVLAMRFRQTYNIRVEGGNFMNLHSVMWATGVTGITVNGIVAENCKEGGLSLGTSTDLIVENVVIEGKLYGIRLGGNNNSTEILGGPLTVTASKIKAKTPVLARNANSATTFTFNGTNVMTEENDANDYWCIICDGGYNGEETPTYPLGQVTVVLNDTGLSYDGVYGNYGVAKIGDVVYTTFNDAYNAATENNNVITLLADAVVDQPVAKPITINGNEKQLAGNMLVTSDVTFGGKLGLTNNVKVTNGATLTIAEGAEVTGAGTFFGAGSDNSYYGMPNSVTAAGTIKINGNVDIQQINANNAGVVTVAEGAKLTVDIVCAENGDMQNAVAGVMNISGNVETQRFNIFGGSTVNVNATGVVSSEQVFTSSNIEDVISIWGGAKLVVNGTVTCATIEHTDARHSKVNIGADGTLVVDKGGRFTCGGELKNAGELKVVLDCTAEVQSLTGNGKVTVDATYMTASEGLAVKADVTNFNGEITVVGGSYEKISEGIYVRRTTEFFYTAAGVETTQDQAAYSLMFTITDNANKEVSVKIGSMKPANNSKAVLVIPATVAFNGVNETFKVTAIEDDAFNSCRNFVGDLTLPQYVRTIGDRAFNTCHYITNPEHPKGKLTLNEGLISIGTQAFTNSYFTDGLSIPRSVTMIEPNAFQYAKINGALTINSDVECALAFNSSEFTKVEIAEGVHKICANAFNGMVNVTEVVLPSTLTEIGLAAFSSDNAIETIWSNAAVAPTILWQSNIESNKHPFTQTVRDNAVVFVTTNYKNYTEAEKWKEFANIYGLYPIQKTGYSLLVKVNDNVCSVEIGDKPHQNDRIELELPRTIEYYGEVRAVTSIAKGGFKSCPFFGTLTIPGNIETIADNAFNTCMQFNKLVIEEGVETIGNGSFSMCSGVDYISFPSTLESIGQNAFNVVYMGNGGRIVSFAANPPTAYKHIYNQGINPVNPSFPQNLRNNAILYVFEESLDKYKSATGWEFIDVRPIEAKIGETYYLTLTEAIAAATSGQTITLLADVEAADGNPVLIPEGVTLDINTHNVTANIYGTVKTSGGLWTTVTVPGFNSRKMLGNGAIYNTNNATVANSANEVNMLAGSIVLNPNPETEWWTLPDQNLSIASGASFEVPANIKFTVRENTHVVVEGELTVNGVVYLQMGATVKAAAGLNILTDVEGYMVSYENGVYSVVQAIFTQTTQLGNGWNWFSYYVETDLAELENALGENGVQIAARIGFVNYYNGVWNGTLTSVSPEQMYTIYTNTDKSIALSGEIVEDVNIPLRKGWNWIGYPLNESVEINKALANHTPNVGDQISARVGFATYYANGQWIGSLQQMNPGQGYKYYSNSTSTDIVTFVYSKQRGEAKPNITADNNHWIPNAGQYANNMTMTAMVNVEGNYEIAAFVNGEVRGSARPIYVEALDSYIYFLTIHGDEVEEMSFRLYDLDTDIEYNLSDRMNYSNDAIVGSLTEPYMFNLEMLGIGENSAESFNIYPNPTTTNAEINLNATCDKVEVFNALGVKIAEYSNVDSIDAVETAGIYVIRVTDNGNVQHCRLIVK